MELQPNPDVDVFIEAINSGGDFLMRHRVSYEHGNTGGIFKPFFMAEHDRFAPDLEGIYAGTDGDPADGGSGCFGQLRLRFFRDKRAGGEFSLTGGKIHRESQAGGNAALAAVGLGQQFKNLYSGECH